jgi:hypothetical protein
VQGQPPVRAQMAANPGQCRPLRIDGQQVPCRSSRSGAGPFAGSRAAQLTRGATGAGLMLRVGRRLEISDRRVCET